MMKVNDSTFLIGEECGYIELRNRKDLTCLSLIQLYGHNNINQIEKLS